MSKTLNHWRHGTVERGGRAWDKGSLALFAGFVLSFSKILSDCCLLARPLMMAIVWRSC
jgi:hypothetical protein